MKVELLEIMGSDFGQGRRTTSRKAIYPRPAFPGYLTKTPDAVIVGKQPCGLMPTYDLIRPTLQSLKV